MTPSLADRLRDAIEMLGAAGVAAARSDAEWLLADLLGVGRFEVYLACEHDVAPAVIERFADAVRRRASGEPLQQILGWEEFRGLRVRVTRDVLVPRPETEMLVERALACLPLPAASRRLVVDVGTGSGCIACALAHERADVDVVATDVSPAAARVAHDNVVRLGLDSHVTVVVADLLDAIGGERVDLVVSNPPYLTAAMLAAAPREVSEHEPHGALVAADGGVAVLAALVADARRVLRPGGALAVETAGEAQIDRVARVFGDAGYRDVAIDADLTGRRRIVSGQYRAA